MFLSIYIPFIIACIICIITQHFIEVRRFYAGTAALYSLSLVYNNTYILYLHLKMYPSLECDSPVYMPIKYAIKLAPAQTISKYINIRTRLSFLWAYGILIKQGPPSNQQLSEAELNNNYQQQ